MTAGRPSLKNLELGELVRHPADGLHVDLAELGGRREAVRRPGVEQEVA